MDNRERQFSKRISKRREHLTGGILLLTIGGIWFSRQLGVDLPGWLFTWPMILIVTGLFVGIKTQFRDFGWLVLLGVGTIFLLDKMHLDISIREFIWPILIMGAGVVVLLSAFFRRSPNIKDEDSNVIGNDKLHNEIPFTSTQTTAQDIMEVVSIFGSTKRIILSKDFKGGEIVSVFGSSEINLTNADFTGKLVLEIVQVFGGTKLIIPPHWEVQSQTACFFGGVEDKRSIQGSGNPEKILVIDGAAVFGGVTIASY